MTKWLISAIFAALLALPAAAKDYKSCSTAGKLKGPGAIQCAPLVTDPGQDFDLWNKMVIIKNGHEVQFLSPAGASAKEKWSLLLIMVSAAKTMNPDAQVLTLLEGPTNSAEVKALANGDTSLTKTVGTARYDLMADVRALSPGVTFPMGHHQEPWTLIVY